MPEQRNLTLQQAFDLKGRANIREYRLIVGCWLFASLISYYLIGRERETPCTSIFGSATGGTCSEPIVWLASVGLILGIAASTFMLAASARRWHDLGQSGWLALIYFVPLANLGMLLFLCFSPGDKEANRFGETPPEDV